MMSADITQIILTRLDVIDVKLEILFWVLGLGIAFLTFVITAVGIR